MLKKESCQLVFCFQDLELVDPDLTELRETSLARISAKQQEGKKGSSENSSSVGSEGKENISSGEAKEQLQQHSSAAAAA